MAKSNTIPKTLDKFGILVPEYARDPERKPFTCLQDVLDGYPTFNDPYGNPARQVECFGRYQVTGVIERCHPMGVTDCKVKAGVTLEFKTGHGWIVEPCFETLEGLQEYVAERANPMMSASHIAYVPCRVEDGYDVSKAVVMSAQKFISIMGGKYNHLVYKENKGAWGIAMLPWIREGYVQKPSAKKEKAILDDLKTAGESLKSFTERMGLTWHDLPKL